MAGEINICNSALAKIGQPAITTFTEGSDAANWCSTLYEPLRDDLLRAHAWNFAVKRVKLARLVAEPVFGFDYQYQLPANCLRVLDVFGDDAGDSRPVYRLEERMLLSDWTDIWLEYIDQISDANVMAADFREILAIRLASELAISLANSNARAEALMELYERRLGKARSTDAIENYPERLPEGSWVTERWS